MSIETKAPPAAEAELQEVTQVKQQSCEELSPEATKNDSSVAVAQEHSSTSTPDSRLEENEVQTEQDMTSSSDSTTVVESSVHEGVTEQLPPSAATETADSTPAVDNEASPKPDEKPTATDINNDKETQIKQEPLKAVSLVSEEEEAPTESSNSEAGDAPAFEERTLTGEASPQDLQAQRRKEQDASLEQSKDGEDVAPWKGARKAVVGALGGTMVGVGIILVPIPVPLGALTISAGMAVLSTEFDEAKTLNAKLIKTTKETASKARDKMIETIETLDGEPGGDKKNLTKENETETTPSAAFYMNHAERQRQERVLELEKEKQRKQLEEQREKALEQSWSKKTGSFLSRTVLPYLKKAKATAAAKEAEGDKRESDEKEEVPPVAESDEKEKVPPSSSNSSEVQQARGSADTGAIQ